VETGIEVLDRHVGGFYVGPSYLLKGEPGTAKGLLAIEFLYRALEAGEGAVLVSTDRPENVLLVAESIGLSLGKFVEDESLVMLETIPEFEKILVSPEDIPLMVGEIRSYCSKAKAKRLVINSLSSLIDLAYRMTFTAGHVQTLVRNLDSLGIMTLLVSDSLGGGDLWEAFERAVFGVLRTDRDPQSSKRHLTFEKMKGTQVPQEPIEFGVEYGTGLVLCGGGGASPSALLRLREMADRLRPECDEAIIRRAQEGLRFRRSAVRALRDLVSAAMGASDAFQLVILKLESAAEITDEALIEKLLPTQTGDVICWKRPTELVVLNTGFKERAVDLPLKASKRMAQVRQEGGGEARVFIGWAVWPAEAANAEDLIQQALSRMNENQASAGCLPGLAAQPEEGK